MHVQTNSLFRLSVIATILSVTPNVSAQTLKVIAGTYTTDANVILDSSGNLYGTSNMGGNLQNCGLGCGTVFELSPTSRGGWIRKTLHGFAGKLDGDDPEGGLVLDAAGNLYGTTWLAGDPTCLCGTVFKLSPTSSGQWQETVIHRFKGTDGSGPVGNLIFDPAGNLYGVTEMGGAIPSGPCQFVLKSSNGCGTVFMLSPTSSGQWKETVLHNFTGKSDGNLPQGSLLLDAKGNLYGATAYGGTNVVSINNRTGQGVIFQLFRAATGWKETVLHKFTGKTDGAYPGGSLIFNAADHIIGTAGVAFELAPDSSGGWKETVIFSFTGANDGGSSQSLTFDASGNLWGAGVSPDSGYCYPNWCADVFKLTPSPSGWTESVVYQDLGLPSFGGLTVDSAGNVYGTISGDYQFTGGSVFKLTP